MNILCFGDSNTWGFDADNMCRFPKEIRWTNKLQKYLGENYTVSEFGICDMTFGTPDPFYDCCDGGKNIIPAIRANSPVDYVVVSLGINDCKKYLFNSLDTILQDAGKLIYKIQRYSDLNTSSPKAIVCAQVVPHEKFIQSYPEEFDGDSVRKIFQLNGKLKRLCEQMNVLYCDVPYSVDFGVDEGHYSAEGHDSFAKNLAEFIKSL